MSGRLFEVLSNAVNSQKCYLSFDIVKEMNIHFLPLSIHGLSMDICSWLPLTPLRVKIIELWVFCEASPGGYD